MHCVSMHFAVFYIALHNAITKYCIVQFRAVQSVMGFVYSSLYHLESCRSAKYTFVSSKMISCLLFIFSKRLIFFNLVRLMCGGFLQTELILYQLTNVNEHFQILYIYKLQ